MKFVLRHGEFGSGVCGLSVGKLKYKLVVLSVERS